MFDKKNVAILLVGIAVGYFIGKFVEGKKFDKRLDEEIEMTKKYMNKESKIKTDLECMRTSLRDAYVFSELTGEKVINREAWNEYRQKAKEYGFLKDEDNVSTDGDNERIHTIDWSEYGGEHDEYKMEEALLFEDGYLMLTKPVDEYLGTVRVLFDWAATVGTDVQYVFGDDDVAYIRNEDLMTDFEITRMNHKYFLHYYKEVGGEENDLYIRKSREETLASLEADDPDNDPYDDDDDDDRDEKDYYDVCHEAVPDDVYIDPDEFDPDEYDKARWRDDEPRYTIE